MLSNNQKTLKEQTTSANNTCDTIGRVLLSCFSAPNKPKNLPSFSLPIV